MDLQAYIHLTCCKPGGQGQQVQAGADFMNITDEILPGSQNPAGGCFLCQRLYLKADCEA